VVCAEKAEDMYTFIGIYFFSFSKKNFLYHLKQDFSKIRENDSVLLNNG